MDERTRQWTGKRDEGVEEDIEDLVREQLQPRQAPAGFSDRVMARVPEIALIERRPTSWTAALRWVAAVALLGIAGGSFYEHQQKERVAGEHARDQLMLALRMSAATLNDVQHKVVTDTKGDSE